MAYRRLENIFAKMSFLFEKSKLLNEIVQSFVTLIPIFMIGAFVLVIQYFPIPEVANWVQTAFGGVLFQSLNLLYNITYGLVAIYIIVILSYKYSVALTGGISNVNIINVVTSLAAYFIIIGGDILNGIAEGEKVLLLQYTNERNVFVAVIVAVLSTRVAVHIHNYISRDQTSVHIKTDFLMTFKGMCPMFITLSFFVIVQVAIRKFTPFANLACLINEGISMPFKSMGQSVLSGIITSFLQCIMWFFGIHGSNTFKDLVAVVFPDGSGDIFSKTFFDMYSVMGGSGLTLGLLIIGLCMMKKKEERQLMFSSLIPGIFNINEIIIFGLPIVLNPIFIIPFVCSPIIGFLVAYVATTSGLVPMVVNHVNWTTPPIISGYLATDSWRGAALQIVIIAISMLMYYPFMKLYINIQNSIQQSKIDDIVEQIKEKERMNKPFIFTELPDRLIKVVVKLGMKLKKDVEEERLVIHYQPQVSNDEKVVSSEALLRWRGDTDRVIYPPLVVAIAKEFKIYGMMTRQIVKKTIDDIIKIHRETGEYLPVSVNIDVDQLVDTYFIDWVIDLVKKNKLPDGTLGLEITEQANLVEADNFGSILKRFRENGIVVSIDDFSMGYTSLAYLQMNQFDYVKLDGGIIKNIEKNERSKEIVDSLISLGKNLGFEVVAEYVENENLQSMLQDMGCSKYQGYLYSPAVNVEQYIDYIKNLNKN